MVKTIIFICGIDKLLRLPVVELCCASVFLSQYSSSFLNLWKILQIVHKQTVMQIYAFVLGSLTLKEPGRGGGRNPGVMTRRCVIGRWVQRKTDQKLIFNGNYTQIVFFFRIHFHYVLSYLFGLFGVRTRVSIL